MVKTATLFKVLFSGPKNYEGRQDYVELTTVTAPIGDTANIQYLSKTSLFLGGYPGVNLLQVKPLIWPPVAPTNGYLDEATFIIKPETDICKLVQKK